MPKGKKQSAPAAKVLSSDLIFQGRVFALKRDRVAEPSGIEATREIIEHPGSVVVLPALPGGRLVLISQYRHAAGQYLWEIVAGHKEPNEDPVEGARRELLEETGYTAKRITKMLEVFPSPGLLSERMDIFLAEGLTEGKARPEDDEKITKKIVTLAEAKHWIKSGKIRDSKSVAGILFYDEFLVRKKR